MNDWVATASRLAQQLDSVPRDERPGMLAEMAVTQSRSVQTLQRMVRAFRYVLSNCKSAGLTLAEVSAPVAAVEVLERLERIYLGPSVPLRRAVLLGRFTFRELLDREREAKASRTAGEGTPEQVGWLQLAGTLATHLFDGDLPATPAGSARSELGPVAVRLRVDWEVTTRNGDAAVYLSPKLGLSASRGLALMEVLPSAVMACFFFDRVVFVAADDEEVEAVRAILGEARNGSIPLEVARMPKG